MFKNEDLTNSFCKDICHLKISTFQVNVGLFVLAIELKAVNKVASDVGYLYQLFYQNYPNQLLI